MRCMKRNMQNIYYALYAGKEEILDENGNATATFNVLYSNPVRAKMNVSPAQGSTGVELFGKNTVYSKTMVTHDVNCPITETSVIWIDRSTDLPHNYTVIGIAKSANSIVYALKETEIS